MDKQSVKELSEKINSQTDQDDTGIYPVCIWNHALQDSFTIMDRGNIFAGEHNHAHKGDVFENLQDYMELVMFSCAITFLSSEKNNDRVYPELCLFVERIANKILKEGK